MSDAYERWIERRRRTVDVPDGFADRVMEDAAVVESAPERVVHWLDRPWVQVAAWVAAFFALTVRMVVAGALFLSS